MSGGAGNGCRSVSGPCVEAAREERQPQQARAKQEYAGRLGGAGGGVRLGDEQNATVGIVIVERPLLKPVVECRAEEIGERSGKIAGG